MGSLSRTMGHPPREWLRTRVTVDEAERAMRGEAATFGSNISDGWLRDWSDFKGLIREGDELWRFEWFPEPLSGAAGYCILRDGYSVASIATARA